MKLQDLDTLRVGDLLVYGENGTHYYKVDNVLPSDNSMGAWLSFHYVRRLANGHTLVTGTGHNLMEFDGSIDIHLPHLFKVVA
jgi:hypothetical protein